MGGTRLPEEETEEESRSPRIQKSSKTFPLPDRVESKSATQRGSFQGSTLNPANTALILRLVFQGDLTIRL